jgi:hypothetical protein
VCIDIFVFEFFCSERVVIPIGALEGGVEESAVLPVLPRTSGREADFSTAPLTVKP